MIAYYGDARMGAARGKDDHYLDEERTGDRGNVGDGMQNASTPEEPEEAVIDGE